MYTLFRSSIIIAVFSAALIGCSPAVQLPGVHEPFDSPAWKRCAGELSERESIAMIDDLTLDAKTLLCQGVVLAIAGNVDEGLDLLTESGVRDKSDHRPHYLSGRIFADAGRYEEALGAFERSAKRFPSMEVPTERLGHRIVNKNGPVEARVFLSKARERNLCPYGCKGLLAKLYHREGEKEKAEAIYNEMIVSEPGEPAAYVGLAGLRNSASKYRKEADQLERARTSKHFAHLGPVQQADILYSLAFARYNADEHVQAGRVIERAIEIKGDRADWQVLAGWISLKRERYDEALSWFEKAKSIDSRLAAAHTGLGDAQVGLGNFDTARSAFDEAYGLDPMNSVIILKLAHATAKTGDLDNARSLVDEAARLDKEHLPSDLLAKVTDLLKQEEQTADKDTAPSLGSE